jgi:hypothetical protein
MAADHSSGDFTIEIEIAQREIAFCFDDFFTIYSANALSTILEYYLRLQVHHQNLLHASTASTGPKISSCEIRESGATSVTIVGCMK